VYVCVCVDMVRIVTVLKKINKITNTVKLCIRRRNYANINYSFAGYSSNCLHVAFCNLFIQSNFVMAKNVPC